MHWRRLVEVIVDFVLITGSFVAAYAIVFGWPGTIDQRHIRDLTLPIVLAARYLTFIPFGLYRSVWRYAGARDAVTIAAAVVVSEAIALVVHGLTQDMRDFQRSFFIVDALICMVAIGASRFAERPIVIGRARCATAPAAAPLIVGAGRTGRSLMRELRETAGERVIGFVDDNPRLRRRSVHGVKVLGTTHELDRGARAARRPTSSSSRSPTHRARPSTSSSTPAPRPSVTCRFVRREIDLDPRVVLGATAE